MKYRKIELLNGQAQSKVHRIPSGFLAWIGNAALGGQFGEQDPKGPDVRLDGEASVQSGLGRRPLDGELGSWDGTG